MERQKTDLERFKAANQYPAYDYELELDLTEFSAPLLIIGWFKPGRPSRSYYDPPEPPEYDYYAYLKETNVNDILTDDFVDTIIDAIDEDICNR